MAESNSWQEQERDAANKASRKLRSSLRSVIGEKFINRSGALLRTDVRPRYVNGLLDRLVISSPYYSFMLHYGFSEPNEKVKSASRSATFVRSHVRRNFGGFVGIRRVESHARKGSVAKAFTRNISVKEREHFSEALSDSNVLDTLADDLANSRAVKIVSQINF